MIIVVILGVVMLIASIVSLFTDKKSIGIVGCIMSIIVILFGSSISFVPTGYVGIRTAYGQIAGTPASSGLHFHVPFVESIHNVNCKQQEIDFKDTKIWSETSERTEIYAQNVVVDYQINSEYATWIWMNVEEWDRYLVKQTAVESGIKSAMKRYNDTDVTDRSKIEKTAKEAIQEALNEKYGNQIVNVIDVTIGNMNFSDAYNEAIEKKAQAKLAAETEEYENKKITEKKKAEAEQRKIEAESKAETKKIEAEADAKIKITEAEAQAKANKMISDSITDKILINKYLDNMRAETDKWDGKRSMVSDSNGTNVYNMKDIKDMLEE